jgi:hypothetical protein
MLWLLPLVTATWHTVGIVTVAPCSTVVVPSHCKYGEVIPSAGCWGNGGTAIVIRVTLAPRPD